VKAFKHIPFIPNLKLKRPSIERFGIWYFKKRRAKAKIEEGDTKVHHLTIASRKKLKRLERGAIIRSAIAGSISAFVAAVANYYAYYLIDDTTHVVSTTDYVEYWSIVGGVTAFITLFEILYIYVDSLRTIYRFSQVAGLPLFPEEETTTAIAYSLARAALELPNPIKSELNVDPNRESPTWKVILSPVVYKLKIMATNFLAKMLIRRVAGRAVARVYIEFIAVPISALWNAAVSYMVMRQARLRALGPSFTLEFVEYMLRMKSDFSVPAKQQMIRAVGSSIVRSESLHPNLEVFLYILMEQLDQEDIDAIDDTEHFIEHMVEIEDEEEVQWILQTLIVAAVVDGRVKPKETKLLIDAFENAGYEFSEAALKDFRKKFTNGNPITLPVVPMVKIQNEKESENEEVEQRENETKTEDDNQAEQPEQTD
jgi:hypothetical protein